MRIIAGKAKGRKLKVPKEVTRPSMERMREAVFSILGAKVEGAKVLDLFAGSGSLGLEALSRGANQVDFVDRGRGVAQVLRANVAGTGLSGAGIHCADVFDWLERRARSQSGNSSYDLIFADPPYWEGGIGAEEDFVGRLVASEVKELISSEGILIAESSERYDLDLLDWSLLGRRRYGTSAVWLLHRPSEGQEEA